MLFVARSLIRTSTLNHQCRQRFHLLSFPTPPPANGSSANKVVNMTGFQRFWFASTASPSPFENDSTQTAIGQDKMNEDINDTSVDVKSRLSIDELVKLVSEKEELLKAEQRKLEKMQDEVIRNNAEIEKMENILVIAKQEAANYAKIENQKFAKKVLDVANNLVRASSFVEASLSNIDQSKDSAGAVPLLKLFLERLVMTTDQLLEVLPASTYADTLCQSSVVVKSPKRVEKYNPRKVDKYYPDRPPPGTGAAV
ncbi:hypothetical protein AQUCO_03200105v1 [Aquilegia coerulea]|uniref:Uncharacterized protein n=1 Tax=Aquilegia coerulea TaxID=218851 RepID=A0A2G5D075_AQUCA|nr:hypothetical protein AQUCO_03200105v1 [Aquilegia coerulea]